MQEKILIVEDDEDVLNMHELLISKLGYQSIPASNGSSALTTLDCDQEIRLILCDINMPDINGYDLCKDIKSNENLKDIPLVFVSALTDIEEKIRGYEAGADDYIEKPIEENVLKYKIKSLLDSEKHLKDLNEQIVESHKTTEQIMKYYGDLGQVLDFYNTIQKTHTFEYLSDTLFSVTDNFQLNCVIQFDTTDGLQTFSSTGTATPLESNLLELSRNKERFLDFGARTIINYSDFSLLIKNMPITNQERYGILKDTLGALCNALASRVDVLNKYAISNKKDNIVSTVKLGLEKVRGATETLQERNIEAIETMMDDIENAFISLGLSDEQENNIRHIIDLCRQRMVTAFEDGKEIVVSMSEIDRQLDQSFQIGKST
ncbi:MAG: response regulator [Gammaproteobacteria bacterium]|nr:response regulator [Gammaproteobacteria bacterium]MDH5730393.1 response regulator [Gammaproteobacteria bacterium]